MDLYDKLVRNWSDKTIPKEETKDEIRKGKRPLKMPKGYDFTVRNVDWREYKNDFLLRTDAVWEKSKLKDHFYSMYKIFVYNEKKNAYYISDLRVVPNPTTEIDHFLEFVPFQGFTVSDGLVWTVKNGPKIFGTSGFSHFT